MAASTRGESLLSRIPGQARSEPQARSDAEPSPAALPPASAPAAGAEPLGKRGWRSWLRQAADRLSAARSKPSPVPARAAEPLRPRPSIEEPARHKGLLSPSPAVRRSAPRPLDEESRAPARRAQEDAYWRPVIDPMRVLSGIFRAKWLILLTTILGAVLGVLVALATPKQYYSATEILFDPRDLQIVERELTGGNLPSDATLALIENQVAIIRSGTVLTKVAERLNLAADPEFNGQGGSLLGTLLNPRALLSFGSSGGEDDAQRQQALAVQNLAEKLNVERNERTFVIHIGATTEDPEKSARIANTTAEVFVEQTGEMQRQTANRATTEISGGLQELQGQVEAAERAVADFKARHDIIDADGRLITDDEIVRLNDQLSTARARTAELQARVDSARDLGVEQVLGGALPEQVSSPVMTELLAQYAGLKQQADRAATSLGPRHPSNQAIQAELAGARQAIASELQRVTASTQVELSRARQLEQELASRLAQLKVEKGDLEAQRVQLRELEREAAARRAVYESFLLRARETGQQRSLNTANFSIISTAYPPLLPTGTSRASMAIAGTILGFLAGIGIGAARGTLESLRENTAARRSAPPMAPRRSATAGTYRRRDEDYDDFDPPPEGSADRGGNYAAAAAGGRQRLVARTRTGRGRSTARLSPLQEASPPDGRSSRAAESRRADEPELSSPEQIRESLQELRRELDALVKERSRPGR
ncbi:GumC family protein [Chelativorans sp.]|uniref:GumC family protein n=1 Tax=Chelativorans sp. TaxID=2203393 RepID=UPI002811D4B6|nr:GumC family protein [Chelativorans sp.]